MLYIASQGRTPGYLLKLFQQEVKMCVDTLQVLEEIFGITWNSCIRKYHRDGLIHEHDGNRKIKFP